MAFSHKYTHGQRVPRLGSGGKSKGKQKMTTQCVFEKERLMTFSTRFTVKEQIKSNWFWGFESSGGLGSLSQEELREVVSRKATI